MFTGLFRRAGRSRSNSRKRALLKIGIRRSRMMVSGRLADARSSPPMGLSALYTVKPSRSKRREHVTVTHGSSSRMRIARGPSSGIARVLFYRRLSGAGAGRVK